MNNPKIKICGMTRASDIEAAETLGANYIGLIFVPSSPRSVSRAQAQELRPHIRSAHAVGVFAEHDVQTIKEYADALKLNYVQLHGDPDLAFIQGISVPCIQAFRGVPDEQTAASFLDVCEYILIDKAEGEDTADFDAIAQLPSKIRSRLFLAGGLHPENVADAILRIQPYAVDVARGVESHAGVKDHDLLTHFVARCTVHDSTHDDQLQKPATCNLQRFPTISV